MTLGCQRSVRPCGGYRYTPYTVPGLQPPQSGRHGSPTPLWGLRLDACRGPDVDLMRLAVWCTVVRDQPIAASRRHRSMIDVTKAATLSN